MSEPAPRAPRWATIDGNEACARVAYATNEICAIYPITPSSPMAELADQWASEGRTNLWGNVPSIVEMQSEGGVAGAVHGALQTGGLTTTFTASQGLLLMIPNMYKIAGELTSAVFHVAARALAAQGLSIFGDHQDVMAARATGFAMLCSASVQEAQDLALIAQAASLEARLPFVHFFDGFRTSHEVNKIALLERDQIRALIPQQAVLAHRERALNPDRPCIRGTAQNPDVYFQAREAANPYYERAPGIVAEAMAAFERVTGRAYHLFDYHGHPQADRVVVIMGSGAPTARETAAWINAQGKERVGVLQVRLYRPFDASAFAAALPDTVGAIAVLDRTKEPGAAGEPLYLDVVAALAETAHRRPDGRAPRVIGGRYGLSSKEFTPAMAARVFEELARAAPKNHFTVGIHDDVGGHSLDHDPSRMLPAEGVTQAIFYGLGADGTVGANKNSVKILGEEPDRYAQAYFVYDSKKSGSRTVSHLRFGPRPIEASYLITAADFVACHQFEFIERLDVLEPAAAGATLLLNSPHPPDEVWDRLPREAQAAIIDKQLKFHVIDAYRVAREAGLGRRINTVMQVCFFALSGVLPREQALAKIRDAIRTTYGARGEAVVAQNFTAVERTLDNLHRVAVPQRVTATGGRQSPVAPGAPEFVRRISAVMIAGRGDELPVSALPVDGSWPSGTAAWEKRGIADEVAAWEPDICIQCGNCALVCPHGVIRAKLYSREALADAPAGFQSAPLSGRGFPDMRYTLQVYLEDCTGCGLCVDACPARAKEATRVKAINLTAKASRLADERANIGFFEGLPEVDRARVDSSTVRGVQYLPPLFAFSGACAGCGETPYLQLLSQLFGERAVIANATGCSSIYGGNLPTTPWSASSRGRGPAWSNSLFEDNAEFGFGFRLSADQHLGQARELLRRLRPELGDEPVAALLDAPQDTDSQIEAQRGRVAELKQRLAGLESEHAAELASLADHLVRRSVWIVGGDGWAYDIGYGGLDHVLAMDRDVNVLVLDTEVYSNTGGQMSKATPLGAVAKFAAAGKSLAKKDLALQAIAYGNVYVARIALGANPQQAVLAFREAERFPGPSLILAYSHCIAHGIDMARGLRQQKLAVESGHWPLLRYNPALKALDRNPFMLDSPRPTVRLRDYAYQELRYRMLEVTNPKQAAELMRGAEAAIRERWARYEALAADQGSA